jgi:protein-S-isoprenylcysteine O-methyltransferase Ste14
MGGHMVLAVSVWQITCAMLLLACLSSFVWGMRRFFIQPAGPTTGMQITKICGLFFSVLHFVLIVSESVIRPAQALLATMLYVASLVLFWWAVSTNRGKPLSAVFSPDLPMHFVSHGPYAWVRHPFYTSYLLTWLAGVVATGHLWLLFTVLVMVTIYWRAALLEEKKFFQTALASLYAAYKSRTGLFAPSLGVLWMYFFRGFPLI